MSQSPQQIADVQQCVEVVRSSIPVIDEKAKKLLDEARVCTTQSDLLKNVSETTNRALGFIGHLCVLAREDGVSGERARRALGDLERLCAAGQRTEKP